MEQLIIKATRRRRSGEQGFTLIELLVVIAVLAILAAIVIFNVVGVSNNGKTSACQTDTKSVQTASDAYYNDKGVYPNKTSNNNPDSATITIGNAVNISELVPTYIHTAPGNGETFTWKDTGGTVQGFVSGSTTAC